MIFMINKINIGSFGCFKDFDWDVSVRDTAGNNIVSFKKLNIFYGRNYSGKTTISRIIQCLETKVFPKNYENVLFSIKATEGEINSSDIQSSNCNVRVYNKDFVDTHLGFLKDENGDISPFAVIGEENNTIENKIKENDKTLGEVDTKTGLRYEYSLSENKTNKKNQEKEAAKRCLQKKLKNKATGQSIGIKYNTTYNEPNYNITKISRDIEVVRSNSLPIIEDEQRNKLKGILKDTPLPDIQINLSFNSSLVTFLSDANLLLLKKVTPKEAIQELLEDATLQAWVETGIHHHKDKRDDCAFCGNTLPQNLWDKMSKHFSKESKDLGDAIESLSEKIQAEVSKVNTIPPLNKAKFYSSFHELIEVQNEKLSEYKKEYITVLNKIITVLTKRKNDIFKPFDELITTYNISDFEKCVQNINSLIAQNDNKSKTLQTDQDEAREKLRLSEIAEYIKEIALDEEELNILTLDDEEEILKKETENFSSQIQVVEDDNKNLRIEIKDEKKGADKVNKYLNNYFGHEGISLEAEEDTETTGFRFRILRGDTPAYNLSEGECSLVAFCYFMAKLEDTESADKKLTIFIDDPISSLDSNHIFFIYSLIESLVTKPSRDENNQSIYGYDQLFISTHNLEFLKYLKKLSKPKNEYEHFLVIGNKNTSTIEPMPKYLKNYITELNYLFGEIYTCADNQVGGDHHSFYNFGNNLRKFLEVFLFFKYPSAIGSESHYNDRITKFFAGSDNTEVLVQRLTNEFSHLGEYIDRGVQPIDQAEISKLALFILTKIKENDSDQYECLLESIEKTDPLEPLEI